MGMESLFALTKVMCICDVCQASHLRHCTDASCLLMQMQLSAEQWQTQRWEREVEQRNRALSDEELDSMMPVEGYKVLEQPAGYAPMRTPARKLMATPTPMGGTPMYQIPEEDHQQQFDVPIEIEGLPEMKPEDQQYFGKLLKVLRVCCWQEHCEPWQSRPIDAIIEP